MSRSVVFLGTSSFAVPCLKALATDDRFSVQLVVTQPDQPMGRKQVMTSSPVKIAATAFGLLIEQPQDINAHISSCTSHVSRPDFLIVVSYGQILSEHVLHWPLIAPINVHASLLPCLRGASPIQHAILEGLTGTGVTVQRMVQELDAGPILTQRAVAIEPRETYTTLSDKLARTGAELLIATLSMALTEREQDPLQITVCRKLKKSDGEAHPETMSSGLIDCMVRALTPWPGVSWNGTKLLETSLDPLPDAMPLPCAGNSRLFVVKIQPAGGKPMSGQAYLRGHIARSR